MTYTGDPLIATNFDGNNDIEYQNGQPVMTDGLETCVFLAIFGEDGPWNGMTSDASERMESDFPAVIRRANVSDDTREEGRVAIEKALAFLVDIKAASSVEVFGEILSARSIGWEIDIEAPTGNGGKFFVNWEKGSLTPGFKRIV